jgi:protocatechuate 3,4-dioxygenase beta subunit
VRQTRRQSLAHLAAFGLVGAGAVIAERALANTKLEPTPIMSVGPYYPVQKPLKQITDLTRQPGYPGRAKGQILDLTGRVLTADGKPVANARIELWQANAAGRYRHHGDTHNAPLDPNFSGYAVETTDADGRYRFLTVKPGPYPGRYSMRARHIHFDVTGRWDRLVTQMYFPGDPLLAQDKVLHGDMFVYDEHFPASIFAQLKPTAPAAEKDATLCLFDIVLRDG